MKKIKFIKSEISDYAWGVFSIAALVQIIIGVIFLIPPILGAIFFTLELFGVSGDSISLRELSTNWTGDSNAMSAAAPIYLGLMAFAGSFMVYSAISNLMNLVKSDSGIDNIEGLEITEE